MKKISFVIPLFILFGFLTACNADDKKIVIMEDVNNPSREEIRAKTQNQPVTDLSLSQEVGIGAAREQFDQAYGRNDGNLEIARYQGEFMIVTFEQHRAMNIQYQFGNKPGNRISEDEIYSYIQERLPNDAVEIKQVNENNDRIITEYRSESLRKAMSSHSFRGEDPGSFVVIIHKNEQGEISAIVSTGGIKES